MNLIEKLAFSASMNANTLTEPGCSSLQRRPLPFRQILFHLQHPNLGPQPFQLRLLIGRETWTDTCIDLWEGDPVHDRLRRRFELASQLRRRTTILSNQPNNLRLALLEMPSMSHGHCLSFQRPPKDRS